MSNVVPTRMELLKTRSRVKLAKKGHKLLKQKRDALIMEFFKIMKKAKSLRKELYDSLSAAYESLYFAEVQHTREELEYASFHYGCSSELDIEVSNVMGVRVPSISGFSIRSVEKDESDAFSALTSPALDSAASNFQKVLDLIVQIAEIETSIVRLLLEIEKTKRRVNSLEYVLIPNLESVVSMIRFKLEELERDAFVSLKTIKKKINSREKT